MLAFRRRLVFNTTKHVCEKRFSLHLNTRGLASVATAVTPALLGTSTTTSTIDSAAPVTVATSARTHFAYESSSPGVSARVNKPEREYKFAVLPENEHDLLYKELLANCHSAARLKLAGYRLTTTPPEGVGQTARPKTWDVFEETPRSVPGESGKKRKAIVLDCERVELGPDGRPEVAYISAVDFFTGEILLNGHVQFPDRDAEGNPLWSKPRWRRDVVAAAAAAGQALQDWQSARRALWEYAGADTVLIGHALHNDLSLLRIIHRTIVDSSILTADAVFNSAPAMQLLRIFRLKIIARDLLGQTIQSTGRKKGKRRGHDCLEDTYATRDVVISCLRYPKLLAVWASKARASISPIIKRPISDLNDELPISNSRVSRVKRGLRALVQVEMPVERAERSRLHDHIKRMDTTVRRTARRAVQAAVRAAMRTKSTSGNQIKETRVKELRWKILRLAHEGQKALSKAAWRLEASTRRGIPKREAGEPRTEVENRLEKYLSRATKPEESPDMQRVRSEVMEEIRRCLHGHDHKQEENKRGEKEAITETLDLEKTRVQSKVDKEFFGILSSVQGEEKKSMEQKAAKQPGSEDRAHAMLDRQFFRIFPSALVLEKENNEEEAMTEMLGLDSEEKGVPTSVEKQLHRIVHEETKHGEDTGFGYEASADVDGGTVLQGSST
ncbi:hypothetical protein BJX61DRAFT_446080 [Aspergillus egyptiacus]|nr:hypothetical protein BJX61DRAFT_446080 [Aspergillus egyptiacus]